MNVGLRICVVWFVDVDNVVVCGRLLCGMMVGNSDDIDGDLNVWVVLMIVVSVYMVGVVSYFCIVLSRNMLVVSVLMFW